MDIYIKGRLIDKWIIIQGTPYIFKFHFCTWISGYVKHSANKELADDKCNNITMHIFKVRQNYPFSEQVINRWYKKINEWINVLLFHNQSKHVHEKLTFFFNQFWTSGVNSSPPSVAYMRQWIRSALVQIMASRLVGAKPLSEPMMEYC